MSENRDRPVARYGDWSVTDASARFGELLERTAQAPQLILDDDRLPAFVVVSIAEWQEKIKGGGVLSDFFQSSPLRHVALDLERLKDTPRDSEP